MNTLHLLGGLRAGNVVYFQRKLCMTYILRDTNIAENVF